MQTALERRLLWNVPGENAVDGRLSKNCFRQKRPILTIWNSSTR